MKKEIICTICPNSCRIKVEYEGFKILNIDGAKCKKGEEYVKNEILNPVRVFTGSVMVEGGNFLLASVKTPQPIPKKYLRQLGELTHRLKIKAPVEIGDKVAENLLDQSIELIATRKIEKKLINSSFMLKTASHKLEYMLK